MNAVRATGVLLASLLVWTVLKPTPEMNAMKRHEDGEARKTALDLEVLSAFLR